MCLTRSKSALPKALAWKQTHGAQSSWLTLAIVRFSISSVQALERAMHGLLVARIRVSLMANKWKAKEKKIETRFVFQYRSKA
jgi:hypothetical protein